MRLNWLTYWEQVGENTLRQVYYEPDQKFVKHGARAKFCKDCRRWVWQHDFDDYCSVGLHEFAQEVKLQKVEPDAAKASA